jgi:hypothetical protein
MASHVNAAGFIWDKEVDPTNPESKRKIYIKLAQLDKSAVAEHSINHEQIIKLQDTNCSLLEPAGCPNPARRAKGTEVNKITTGGPHCTHYMPLNVRTIEQRDRRVLSEHIIIRTNTSYKSLYKNRHMYICVYSTNKHNTIRRRNKQLIRIHHNQSCFQNISYQNLNLALLCGIMYKQVRETIVQ